MVRKSLGTTALDTNTLPKMLTLTLNTNPKPNPKLKCKPLSAFRNVHHKGSKYFDIQSCVRTSEEKSNTKGVT